MQTAQEIFAALDAVGERAEAYYETALRPALDTPANLGKLLLIDTDTGRYIVGDNRRAMARELGAARPEATYLLRIGYPAVTALGNTLTPNRPGSTPPPVRRSKQEETRAILAALRAQT